jgi:hypothetical protein
VRNALGEEADVAEAAEVAEVTEVVEVNCFRPESVQEDSLSPVCRSEDEQVE